MQQHQPRISPHYDDDFFAWTQHQAKLLRTLERLRAELPAELDLDHVAEEIESLGSAELNSVKSLIRQILVHLIKAASDPKAASFAHWRTEATNFSIDLPDRYARSMQQLIDMQALWRKAMKAADVALSEHGSLLAKDLPTDCPYSVEDIITDDFDFQEALRRLGATRT